MGRINLTALRVRKRALANLETRRTTIRPVWLDVVSDIPPSQIFIRQQPIQHPVTEVRVKSLPSLPPTASGEPQATAQSVVSVTTSTKSKSTRSQTQKPSKLFSPLPIRYEEDTLRKQFYQDHPWELARPRVVLETSGNSHSQANWSTGLLQPGLPLSGESVVQRQLHLLHTVPNMTVPRAYDMARREFYDLRRQEEIRRRVAAEEALATGAYFGKNVLQWSMEVENTQYDDWERWSRRIVNESLQRTAAFEGEPMKAAAEEEEEVLGDALPLSDKDGNGTGSALFANEQARRANRIGKGVVE